MQLLHTAGIEESSFEPPLPPLLIATRGAGFQCCTGKAASRVPLLSLELLLHDLAVHRLFPQAVGSSPEPVGTADIIILNTNAD